MHGTKHGPCIACLHKQSVGVATTAATCSCPSNTRELHYTHMAVVCTDSRRHIQLERLGLIGRHEQLLCCRTSVNTSPSKDKDHCASLLRQAVCKAVARQSSCLAQPSAQRGCRSTKHHPRGPKRLPTNFRDEIPRSCTRQDPPTEGPTL